MAILTGGFNKAKTGQSTPGLFCRLDFSDSDDIALNGSKISNIRDSSGFGNDYGQGTEVEQPERILAAQNGLSVSRYNGTTTVLEGPAGFMPQTSNTVFFVAKFDPTMIGRGDLWGLSPLTAKNIGIFGFPSPTNRLDVFARDDSLNVLRPQLPITFNFAIMGFTREVNRVVLFINNTEQIETGTYNSPSMTGTVPPILGNGGGPLKGDIGEVLFYDRVLNANEISQVKLELSEKWRIPL